MKYPRRKQHVRLALHQRRMVRWFRRHANLTQARIATLFHVTQPTVSNILRAA